MYLSTGIGNICFDMGDKVSRREAKADVSFVIVKKLCIVDVELESAI